VAIDWLNVMVFSEPGVGKTHLLGTAMDHPDTHPLLILDIDGGVTTLRKRTDIDVIQVRSFAQLVKVYTDLYGAIDKDGKLPYKTIGLDTFSELGKLDLATINKAFAESNPNIDEDVPDQRSYYKSGNHMRKITRGFRDLPCNTFYMSHLTAERDGMQRLCYYPQFPGKLRSDLPGFLDVVGYMRAEVTGQEITRYLQVQKTATVAAKDRTGALGGILENPTIPMMWELLKEKESNE
jgi:AAA domain